MEAREKHGACPNALQQKSLLGPLCPSAYSPGIDSVGFLIEWLQIRRTTGYPQPQEVSYGCPGPRRVTMRVPFAVALLLIVCMESCAAMCECEAYRLMVSMHLNEDGDLPDLPAAVKRHDVANVKGSPYDGCGAIYVSGRVPSEACGMAWGFGVYRRLDQCDERKDLAKYPFRACGDWGGHAVYRHNWKVPTPTLVVRVRSRCPEHPDLSSAHADAGHRRAPQPLSTPLPTRPPAPPPVSRRHAARRATRCGATLT